MSRQEFDAYAVLGVSPDAEPEAIAGAYRALAQKYHPDRNPGRPEAGERMKAVNAAYELLGNAERRRAYDGERAAAGRRQETGTAEPPPPPPPRPATGPPVTETPASCAVCGRRVRGHGETCHRCAASRAPDGREKLVAGPAIWVAALIALGAVLWLRVGPDLTLAAAVLALGVLGAVRTGQWLNRRRADGAADLAVLLGWRGSWLAILLVLPLMPLVGLGSACAGALRWATNWHGLRREWVS